MSLQNSSGLFWKGRNILITGADGFIGSKLAEVLLDKGARVFNLSNLKKNPNLLAESKTYKRIYGSVENLNILKKVVAGNKVNLIYHLAAQPLVEKGNLSPIKTFEVNIKGTWNILEAARINKVGKIIIASTAHVYGDNNMLPYRENYFPQPSRPYETSKACADLLAQSYADSFKLSVEIPRFVNIYGPGDFNQGRIMPKVIVEILRGKSPEVWDIGSVRDFLYIDDAIRAYLMLAEAELPNTKRTRVFNFGSGHPVDILDLTERILAISGKKGLRIRKIPVPLERINEIKKQYVSISKAKRELKWVPKTNLDSGLNRTIIWYKNNLPLFS